MIIEYDSIYDEQIKDLLVELQNYLIDIDNWHTQILLPEYRENMFKIDKQKVMQQNGKIYLSVENNILIGLIIGIVEEKDDIDKLTNDCAKTGAILELVVRNDARGQGVGKNGELLPALRAVHAVLRGKNPHRTAHAGNAPRVRQTGFAAPIARAVGVPC